MLDLNSSNTSYFSTHPIELRSHSIYKIICPSFKKSNHCLRVLKQLPYTNLDILNTCIRICIQSEHVSMLIRNQLLQIIYRLLNRLQINIASPSAAPPPSARSVSSSSA